MKIRPVGAELSHPGGRTGLQTDGHDEADSRLSQVCEPTQKRMLIYQHLYQKYS